MGASLLALARSIYYQFHAISNYYNGICRPVEALS